MRNVYSVKLFCKEDPSLIQNYEKTINSDESWAIHHRFEMSKNLTATQLDNMNMYYDRPASELIYLPKKIHDKMHWYHKYFFKDPLQRNSKAWYFNCVKAQDFLDMLKNEYNYDIEKEIYDC